MKGGIRLAAMAGLVLALGMLSGCSGVRNYLSNRAADAADIVRLDVSWSLGTDLGAHVMATRLLRVEAYSYDNLARAGFTWGNAGTWEEYRETLALSLLGWGKYGWLDESWVGIRPPAYYVGGFFPGETWDEIGAGVHLFVVGARVGVRLAQAVDFLFGLLTLDVGSDDLSWPERQSLEAASERMKRRR